MKKYFTFFLFSLLFFTSEIYSQWYVQYQTSGNFLNDIRFINRYTGWACGDNSILKTTNGGINWIPQIAHGYLTQIHPVNDSIAYVCGEYIIMKTTNRGDNWITLREGTGLVPILNGLWFKDENTGWFCGRTVAMRTTNGGKTFIDSQYVPNTLNDIHFKNDSVGVIAAYSKTYRTTNSGINWYPVLLPSTLATPFTERLSFVGDTGWTISRGRTVFKTTNYGISWDSATNIPFGGSLTAHSIEFSSSNTGYCGGDGGKIFKSTNGGFNWNISLQSAGGPFSSIFSFNDSIVWAVGSVGSRYILNTVNGGLTKLINSHVYVKHYNILFQNYPNPFNANTSIKFRIEETSFVKLELYNINGKPIKTIISENLIKGEYKILYNGDALSSGVYFYTLKVSNNDLMFNETKKLLLIK